MSLQDGTYGGNDSIVAFARLHKLSVVIHQLDSPAWEVHGESADGTTSSKSLVRQLHISYHNGDHYASVRSIKDNSDSPANVQMTPHAPATVACHSSSNKHTQLTGMTTSLSYYPHIPIGKVWIYHLLFVCFCLFVCTITDFFRRG